MVLFFHLAGKAVLIRSGYFVEAAVARGRGSLLVLAVAVCFQEREEICVSSRLLPPGKPSVAVRLARRRDAEDVDAQVGGDLDAQACTVTYQIHRGEDLKQKQREVLFKIVFHSWIFSLRLEGAHSHTRRFTLGWEHTCIYFLLLVWSDSYHRSEL